MADEVIIVEAKRPSMTVYGGVAPVLGEIVTTQVLDIGTLSAEFNSDTVSIVVYSKGTGFWFKQGASDVSAAADTNGNVWLEAGTHITLTADPSNRYIDTAADA